MSKRKLVEHTELEAVMTAPITNLKGSSTAIPPNIHVDLEKCIATRIVKLGFGHIAFNIKKVRGKWRIESAKFEPSGLLFHASMGMACALDRSRLYPKCQSKNITSTIALTEEYMIKTLQGNAKIKIGLQTERLKAAKAAVKVAEAQMREAEEELKNTKAIQAAIPEIIAKQGADFLTITYKQISL